MKPGFKKPPEEQVPEEPDVVEQAFDPRVTMNAVRAAVSQSLAASSFTYGQLTEALKASSSIPDGAVDYLREAVRAFSEFHDYIGAALGEMAPSHHDKDLWSD